jgi:hypothetical protein
MFYVTQQNQMKTLQIDTTDPVENFLREKKNRENIFPSQKTSLGATRDLASGQEFSTLNHVDVFSVLCLSGFFNKK